MADFSMTSLAVPAVVLLMAFLAYPSQLLFAYIEPSPLSTQELVCFNLLLAAVWISYFRTCTTDPGHVPKDWRQTPLGDEAGENAEPSSTPRQRWCRKCETLKPPRTHHCKACGRCIPKMDHHCPWTGNCVSHSTFPHFMRFLFYAVAAMAYLEYFLLIRFIVIWQSRDLSSDYGPSVGQLALLLILGGVNFMTLALVFITFARTVWGLGGNVTTIESWEIERHEKLQRRARVLGGYLDGPNGEKVRIQRQEFPYDIGIWNNIVQGMGSSLPLAWLWPFAAAPRSRGLEFETNGFEDPSLGWPPPDPDRMPRFRTPARPDEAFTYPNRPLANYDEIEAFKKRQAADIKRWQGQDGIRHRRAFLERHSRGPKGPPEPVQLVELVENDEDDVSGSESGEESWQDSGGNRLKDYGVDEEIEFYDEDDIPLSELMHRRRMKST